MITNSPIGSISLNSFSSSESCSNESISVDKSDDGSSSNQQTVEDQKLCSWCLKKASKMFSLSTQCGLKLFCSDLCFNSSRKASFKKNKVCDWCKHIRHTVNYVDFQDGRQQLQFCSDKCLNQYKMNVFCRETQAHLSNPHRFPATCSVSPASSSLITPELWLEHPATPGQPQSICDTKSESDHVEGIKVAKSLWTSKFCSKKDRPESALKSPTFLSPPSLLDLKLKETQKLEGLKNCKLTNNALDFSLKHGKPEENEIPNSRQHQTEASNYEMQNSSDLGQLQGLLPSSHVQTIPQSNSCLGSPFQYFSNGNQSISHPQVYPHCHPDATRFYGPESPFLRLPNPLISLQIPFRQPHLPSFVDASSSNPATIYRHFMRPFSSPFSTRKSSPSYCNHPNQNLSSERLLTDKTLATHSCLNPILLPIPLPLPIPVPVFLPFTRPKCRDKSVSTDEHNYNHDICSSLKLANNFDSIRKPLTVDNLMSKIFSRKLETCDKDEEEICVHKEDSQNFATTDASELDTERKTWTAESDSLQERDKRAPKTSADRRPFSGQANKRLKKDLIST